MNQTYGTGRAAYKFDIASVTTVVVLTRYGPDAARQVIESVQEIEDAGPVHGAYAPDAIIDVACTAPRGRAYLVSATAADGTAIEGLNNPDQAFEEIPEPITDVHLPAGYVSQMHASLAALAEAADGDSNDYEIECGQNCADYLSQLLSLLGHPAPDSTQK